MTKPHPLDYAPQWDLLPRSTFTLLRLLKRIHGTGLLRPDKFRRSVRTLGYRIMQARRVNLTRREK